MDHTPNQSDMIAIQEIAVKTTLAVRCWPAGKIDRDVTDQTISSNQAYADAGRFSKRLISKDKLRPLREVANEAKRYWKTHTVPWGERGERLVSGNIVIEFEAKMREFKRKFELEYQKLEAQYLQIVKDEQQNLGGLYNPDDYPDVNQLRDKFGIVFELLPIESRDDLRIKLSGPFMQRIEREAVERERANLAMVNHDVVSRILDVLRHMVQQLSSTTIDEKTQEVKFRKFKNSTVNNVKELCEILPALNLNQDPVIDALADKLMGELGHVDPDLIRNDEGLRTQVIERGQEAIDEIERKMGFLLGINDNDQKAA